MNPNITKGMPVFEMDGDKVGAVRNFDPQTNYVSVKKGFFFPKDTYVPRSAIIAADTDGVRLSLYKDDLSKETYHQPSAPGAIPL